MGEQPLLLHHAGRGVGREGLIRCLENLHTEFADHSHRAGTEILRRGQLHRDLLWALEGAVAELKGPEAGDEDQVDRTPAGA